MTEQTSIGRVAWVDGDPLMEAIAAAVYEHCERHDSGLVIDDPRNIAAAAVAAAVARSRATPTPPPADVRDQTIKALSRVLLDSGGRLVPKHIAETARAVQESADAVLREPAIAEALAGIPLVCSDERHQAKIEKQRKLIEIWQEQARHVTTRAEQAEAAIARVVALATSDRYRIIGQHFLAALDDPQEQP